MDMGKLSGVERRLVISAMKGAVLDLLPEIETVEIDEASMRDLGGERNIRAGVIRHLARGLLTEKLDPKGIRVRGAIFDELVDFDHIESMYPISFEHCLFQSGISAKFANITKLDVVKCLSLTNPETRLSIDLGGAQIGSKLTLDGTVATNDSTPVINGNSLSVGTGFSLKDCKIEGRGEEAAIRLIDANISGTLTARAATILNPEGPAFTADRVNIKKSFFASNLKASVSAQKGAVKIPGAQIGGQMSFKGAKVENSQGPAIDAPRMMVSGSVFMDDEFTAMGYSERGAVRLLGVRVGGDLEFSTASVSNAKGPALFGDYLNVRGDMKFERSVMRGSGSEGVVRLRLASCGGLLSLSEACLSTGARLSRDYGPVLMANGLAVQSNLRLDAQFESAPPRNRRKLPPDPGSVKLRGVSVGGRLILSEDQIRNSSHGNKWEVNDLTFTSYAFENNNPRKYSDETLWLNFLSGGAKEFSPNMYRQLAMLSRNSGNNRFARKYLIAQRWERLRSAGVEMPEWVSEFMLWIFIGFGYSHSRLLLWLVGVFAVSFALSIWMPGGGLIYVAGTEKFGEPCGIFDALSYNMHLVFPFVESAPEGVCEVPSGDSGVVLRAVGMFAQAASWALSILFVAGFTRAVRQN